MISQEQILSLGLSRRTSKAFFVQRINHVMKVQAKEEKSVGAVCICAIIFIASYSFVLQPASKTPSVEGETAVEASYENVFILQTSKGYELYENNSYIKTLTKDELSEERYQKITIYKGE